MSGKENQPIPENEAAEDQKEQKEQDKGKKVVAIESAEELHDGTEDDLKMPIVFDKSQTDEEDDITVLKFIHYYYSSTGIVPRIDPLDDGLLKLIKKLIKNDSIDRYRLEKKASWLKERYMLQKQKSPTLDDFDDPSDREAFQLSEYIWRTEFEVANIQDFNWDMDFELPDSPWG